MPSRNLVSDLIFHAKASRRCLRISSAQTSSGYRLAYAIFIHSLR